MKTPVVAFIGVGSMAEAMIDRAIAGGWPRNRLILTHRRAERRRELARRFGGAVGDDNLAAARKADAVVIAVRPQECAGMLKALSPAFAPGKTLISICAALTVPWLRARLPEGVKVIRVTPPPTAWIGAGVTLMSTDAKLPSGERRAIERLAGPTCERIEWIPDEMMEPITGVTLALTPYTCFLLRALLDTGAEQGIDPAFQLRMLKDGLLATARLLHEGGFTPEQVIEMVATREGLTWSSLHTMEAYGVKRGIRAGARAMTGRSYELRGEAVPDDYVGFLR
jgi:pyrroline-5-carboxylate reductase